MSIYRRFLELVPKRNQRAVLLATLLFGSVGCYLVIHYGLVSRVKVVGPSMEPTLRPGDLRILHRWRARLQGPDRFTVVAIRDPLDEALCVKRVVGLPGETVELRRGAVWIDGRPLAETYLPAGSETLPYLGFPQRFALAADEYLVLGDNRTASIDGRIYGGISRARILGVIRD